MLIMETIAKVRRLYYVENKGFKTIARELRLSKNTVKNILKNDKTKLEYPSRQYQHYPVLGGHKEQLMERLSNDLEEPKRRRRTAKKLHRELQA